MELLLVVLGIPLAGGVVLALVGASRLRAARSTSPSASRTFVAALRARPRASSRDGPLLALRRAVLRRSVQRVPGRADRVRRLHDRRSSRGPTCASSSEHGRMTPRAAAPLPQHVPAVQLHDAARAARPTTWASCGWRWRRRRSRPCCSSALYRTPASLEAAWKYFILCGVGIAQALFGTILLYFAAEKVLGAEGGALLWTHLNA